MPGCLLVKPGVEFTIIAPGGFRILAELEWNARFMQIDLTITSACDGEHSGPSDPHHEGKAYDVRSHDLGDKTSTLEAIIHSLGTDKFYCFLEDAGTDNEHFHCQQRHGIEYP